MIRAIIIDDNADARTTLADDIFNLNKGVEVVAQAESVKSGIAAINKYKPDLVFLDIQMDDGTGFQMLEEIGKYNFKVIFTTGSGDFALKAIKFSAVDYLLKPIDPDELETAIAKILDKEKSQVTPTGTDSINLLIENLKNLNQAPKRVALSSADRIHLVEIKDVIHCESQSNYTLFYLQGNKKILVTRTLKEFEEMFGPEQFIRVHHSHLINLDHLKEYIKANGGYALMADNSKIPVAVRKKDELLRKLGVH
jgi:two-component system LytT family response regulator